MGLIGSFASHSNHTPSRRCCLSGSPPLGVRESAYRGRFGVFEILHDERQPPIAK
jgi:hypothetical protein